MTGLSPASIDPCVELEIAIAPLRIRVIAQRAPSLFNGAVHNISRSAPNSANLDTRQTGCRSFWMDPGMKKYL